MNKYRYKTIFLEKWASLEGIFKGMISGVTAEPLYFLKVMEKGISDGTLNVPGVMLYYQEYGIWPLYFNRYSFEALFIWLFV